MSIFRRRKKEYTSDELTALARLQEVRRRHEIDQAMLHFNERNRMIP